MVLGLKSYYFNAPALAMRAPEVIRDGLQISHFAGMAKTDQEDVIYIALACDVNARRDFIDSFMGEDGGYRHSAISKFMEQVVSDCGTLVKEKMRLGLRFPEGFTSSGK